jgi:transcriptional regulator with XRE-family HTH domain
MAADDRYGFDDFVRRLGDAITRSRVEKRLSRLDVAEAVGMPVEQIEHIENGRGAPRLEFIFNFSNRFGIDIHDLVPAIGNQVLKFPESPRPPCANCNASLVPRSRIDPKKVQQQLKSGPIKYTRATLLRFLCKECIEAHQVIARTEAAERSRIDNQRRSRTISREYADAEERTAAAEAARKATEKAAFDSRFNAAARVVRDGVSCFLLQMIAADDRVIFFMAYAELTRLPSPGEEVCLFHDSEASDPPAQMPEFIGVNDFGSYETVPVIVLRTVTRSHFGSNYEFENFLERRRPEGEWDIWRELPIPIGAGEVDLEEIRRDVARWPDPRQKQLL